MSKLELKIDELVVESFEMVMADNPQGTVFGHETEMEFCGTHVETCQPCEGGESRYQTCRYWATCEGDVVTCHFGGTCYTFDGQGWTCRYPCDPTYDPTCTCAVE